MSVDDSIFVQHICTSHERQPVLCCCCEWVYCTIIRAGVGFAYASTDQSKAVILSDGSFDLMKPAKVAGS